MASLMQTSLVPRPGPMCCPSYYASPRIARSSLITPISTFVLSGRNATATACPQATSVIAVTGTV